MKDLKRLSLFLLLFQPFLICAQSIKGLVLDEAGEALPYATIYQKNSTNGTTSNGDGQFSLKLTCDECLVVFQYIGYTSQEKILKASEKKQITITLLPNAATLGEVVIDGNAEDPAYGIMREAISRRKAHREELKDYSCEAYVKGMQKLLDAPNKIFGQKVGDMGGMLDSTKQGIVYLSESVSKIYHQENPKQSKEIMLSSQVSGEPNGFSLNRANIIDLNFYNERIEVERDILSPLASNAFTYYRFKLLGYRQEGSREVAEIQVIPKRATDPVFGGVLHIELTDYHIQHAKLHLTGKTIQQPVLDTLWAEQQFVPIDGKTERWALLSQNIGFTFGILGFKMQGYFHAVFSNYDTQPDFSAITFGKEVFKVEDKANERDSAYWTALRPIPLTFEEKIDYVRKDSLRIIWESPHYLDSLDKAGNKFKAASLLFGYSHNNSKTHQSWGFRSPINTLLFNTVQGYNLRLNMFYNIFPNKEATKSLYFRPNISYGFAEKKLRSSILIGRRFNNLNKDRLEFGVGSSLEQFDGENPILPFINALQSLVLGENYMKLYQENFAEAQYGGRYKNGIELKSTLKVAKRSALENNSTQDWIRDGDNDYTSNHPYRPTTLDPYFQASTGLFLDLTLRYRFGQKYLSYPKERFYYDEGKPEFYATFKAAAPLSGKANDPNFSQLTVGFEQDYQSVGIGGYVEWNVSAGSFLHKKQLEFMDFQHFQGNQTYFSNPNTYTNRFLGLPYYQLSTKDNYAEAHLQYHLQGFLFNKIPGIRHLKAREVVGISALYTSDKILADGQTASPDLPYWEVNFGLENLGIRAFRLLRVDVVQSFYGTNKGSLGLVVGLGI